MVFYLNVEIHRSWKTTSLCFKSSKTSELRRHLHFQNTTLAMFLDQVFLAAISMAFATDWHIALWNHALRPMSLTHETDRSTVSRLWHL